MLLIIVLGILASVSAAPRGHGYHDYNEFGMNNYFRDDMFDTKRFWEEVRREIFQDIMEGFTKHFPTVTSNEGIIGNEYKIKMSLNGFLEKDVAVKARKGLVMVQAVQNIAMGVQSSFLVIKSLPDYVNENGIWILDNGILDITFPLNNGTEISTSAPNFSREEIENTNVINEENADVGAERGDRDEAEITHNEMPRESKVEATTYAVDLNDEVEFVPVRYR
ncbi:uncharacterized protein LOC126968745 [Leptidea sinapis]|uniref:uncharacterized protein LOC126968745 n=1 Tax=Leptidea sinapis TaxID=189913 RepID=UPI002134D231|nr:uncharacterized protein LOC126968745 [Leptidea sinapis]